ncbi:putative Late nodulin [Medicago truncatula]|uniref:Nodule Cysteine-Rich (NCR) secreted peptide n=1 Tax=Medicago truncatula TaxID=3880 RepID=G7K5Z0_MEDTR|nr:Nodule Cysteine-Rich (NCR) secreted peptide [Medicago truncatula]RHN56791.1 putative Late nodulin [Medicago truncatula]
MAEIIKFVYTMILLLSLFLVTTKVGAYIACQSEIDCPPNYSFLFAIRCIKQKCVTVGRYL